MTTISAPSAPVRSGDIGSTGFRGSRFATRRRVLLLGCVLLLVTVALAANYGPVRHYQNARARLEKTTLEVAALENQRAALRSQLGKLGQAGYLEGLARQELTYARPGEDLYIVSGFSGEDPPVAAAPGYLGAAAGAAGGPAGGASGDAASGPSGRSADYLAGTGIGAAVPGAESVAGLGIGAAGPNADGAGTDRADDPGFLERMLSTLSGLF
ncbi:MAG: septum formation initiator family protein [bacterium]